MCKDFQVSTPTEVGVNVIGITVVFGFTGGNSGDRIIFEIGFQQKRAQLLLTTAKVTPDV